MNFKMIIVKPNRLIMYESLIGWPSGHILVILNDIAFELTCCIIFNTVTFASVHVPFNFLRDEQEKRKERGVTLFVLGSRLRRWCYRILTVYIICFILFVLLVLLEMSGIQTHDISPLPSSFLNYRTNFISLT